MTDATSSDHGLQVKSVERVRDLGEVFTPPNTVGAMLDLLPQDIWQPHPSANFLEPACGDGNFVVAILNRKLVAITHAHQRGRLPAGSTREAAQFHALEALASIYAVDISIDNVIGGTTGHEVGARDRLLAHLRSWHAAEIGGLTDTSPLLRAARWIVERNIQIANMLETQADGTRSGRDELPLIEYTWSPNSLTVALATTTLGDVAATVQTDAVGTMSLFLPAAPAPVWSGKATRMHEAPIHVPANRVTHARNANALR